jgi:hypothetical protein
MFVSIEEPPLPENWFAICNQNRAKQSPEILAPFPNQWVAWRGDCMGIVAAAGSIPELEAELTRRGIDAEKVVFEFVGDADMPALGELR